LPGAGGEDFPVPTQFPGIDGVRGQDMGRRSRDAYEDALGLRESETIHADNFEAEFPVITGRTVEILSHGESPRIALIDGVETGIELTAIHAGSADDIVCETIRLATQKHRSYERRGIFDARPIILLSHLDRPARDVEGPALYDVHDELEHLVAAGDFDDLGFSEIWVMDDGSKYTLRRDPRAPAGLLLLFPSRAGRILGTGTKASPVLEPDPGSLPLAGSGIMLWDEAPIA
jgi:hypothetical protein